MDRDEPTGYLQFCNGCGKLYTSATPAPGAIYDTHDAEAGVLEFCTEECRDAWVASAPTVQ